MAQGAARASLPPEVEAGRPRPWTAEIAPLQGFRPDIQALRGIAVLAVVAFHANGLLPGGYVGVDVFFVISGFVIGRLLLAGCSTGGAHRLRWFYVRRARRLLPALSTMLVIVLISAPLLAPIGARGLTGPTGVAAALFSANLYLYSAGDVGYFDAAADLNPLLHTWSLSVEEQFYFVIPALVLGVWALGRRRNPLRLERRLVGAIFGLSLAACLHWSYDGTIRGQELAFYSPFTRAWQFAAGLALVLTPVGWYRSIPLRRVAAIIGLALIAVAALAYDEETTFPGLAALVPTVGAALVIFGGTEATEGQGRWPRAVAAPLIWLGDRSYSWYLWHLPIIVFAGAYWPNGGTAIAVLAAAASLLPAMASYRALEQPLRSRRPTRVGPTMALAAACIAAPLAAAGLGHLIGDVVSRQAAVAGFDEERALHADKEGGCDNRPSLARVPERTCTWGPADATRSVVLVGDSNAGQFSEALIGAATRDGFGLRIATRPACRFVDATQQRTGRAASPGCGGFVERSLADIEADPPDLTIVANATDVALDPARYGLIDAETGQAATDAEDQARIYEAALRRTVARLQATGTTVALVNVVPKPEGWEPDRCSSLLLLTDPDRCSFSPFAVDEQLDIAAATALERRVAEALGAGLWTFDTDICPDRRCVPRIDGRLVWRDEGHLSVATSDALTDAVREELADTLGP